MRGTWANHTGFEDREGSPQAKEYVWRLDVGNGPLLVTIKGIGIPVKQQLYKENNPSLGTLKGVQPRWHIDFCLCKTDFRLLTYGTMKQ